ncbi:outer membrane protein assembly factor BamA [Ulvibacter sp. MAR_2010_11]|uniref:POTRA domain-containing protein n=1 Tax=Ulvibacter sp. MAR_2010_11 TaxID=1250229 RepID=UPI000C2B9FA8|nr:POTRA domain-containing protein [Ulvibacter sp. MAR_2010_11]PKA83469.1 outer membrane protein assembly factor BamA [Ulvibacter sp. MAR_2010_11]
MKFFLYIFLYLNIYITSTQLLYAQNLRLTVEAENPLPEGLLDILNFQNTFNDYISLKKEADTLAYKLQKIGYIDSELQSLQKKNDSSYRANYFFGKRYLYIKVFYNANDFSKSELQRVSEEVNDTYFVLNFSTFELALTKLNAIKIDKGNAFARVRLDEIEKVNSSTLEAKLVLENRESRTIDSIVVKGYDKFPKSYLKYYAGIKTGKPFRLQKLIAQNEVLNNLGFVSTIKAPEALFRKESTTVYFYLKKQNNNLFDGILGFSTNEESNKLEFNGYLNLELNNNLNYGEQLLINYKSDGNEQQNFRVKVNLPYLFKSPFGAGAELKIFKRDSSFVTTEQQIRVTYQLNPASSAYLGYKGYESSNLLDVAFGGIAIEDYTSRFAISGINFTKQQKSPLFPIKTFLSIDTEIGTRKLKSTKEAQQRFATLTNHILNLNYKNAIFIQNSTSVLLSDTYITNELFRFGGINTMRGFDENSIDASFFSVLNTEYRYIANPTIYIHSIIDLGYFENRIFNQKEKLYSFGIGFGLQTKAGIFKLNLANGNSDSQNFTFSNTKIHLSLSSRF